MPPLSVGDELPALDHAILAVRNLPEAERKHWHDVFDYYVFDANETARAYIPEGKRGLLAPLIPEKIKSIRAKLKDYFQR